MNVISNRASIGVLPFRRARFRKSRNVRLTSNYARCSQFVFPDCYLVGRSIAGPWRVKLTLSNNQAVNGSRSSKNVCRWWFVFSSILLSSSCDYKPHRPRPKRNGNADCHGERFPASMKVQAVYSDVQTICRSCYMDHGRVHQNGVCRCCVSCISFCLDRPNANPRLSLNSVTSRIECEVCSATNSFPRLYLLGRCWEYFDSETKSWRKRRDSSWQFYGVCWSYFTASISDSLVSSRAGREDHKALTKKFL
jgi:hypothetical protein